MKAFQPILLATDLSERSESAVQRVLQLSHVGISRLRLLHVLSASLMEELKRLISGNMHVRLEDTARLQLRTQAAAFDNIGGLETEVRLEIGRPYSVIAAQAAEMDALLVIGAHRNHAVRDWFQGSMLERILSCSQQPLLVVKQPAPMPYRRVLVPVDFSPSSLAALHAAINMAPQAEITLLNVFEIPFESKLRFAGVSDTEMAGYRVSSKEQAERDIAVFIHMLPAGRGARLNSVLEYGYAPEVIIGYAEQMQCDLIVMGRYGSSGVEQLLLGSVTEYVTMECSCDIMVVNEA
jgi:nucleotide-binding universal stress UspA family protein